MKTAVVILNWNGKKFFEKFLQDVINNTISEEIKLIVADNASTDDSVEYLQKFPEVEVIQLDKNYGFAGGYNKALEKIDAEYYVLLNSDVDVRENWVEPIINFMDKNAEIAACMPKIKSYANPTHFEYAGAAGGYIDKYGYPFCRGRILNHIEKDTGQYNQPQEIFWATGACMFVRACAFKEVGGFDTDFFAHMEEIDLCYRLINKDYKIYVFPQITVFHVGGGTLPNNNPRKLFFNYRNSLFMLYKNLPTNRLFIVLFMRLILDGISALSYLSSFSFSYFFAVFSAHIAFYKEFWKLRAKRKTLIQLNNKKIKRFISSKSIVYQFLILKKKTFADIEKTFFL